MPRPTIAVIEDDSFLAEGIQRNIEHYTAHRCRIFTTGKAAIQFCSQHQVTLALIDLGLPDISGFAVIEALRELQPNAGQLILTQRAELAHRLRAFDEGVDDYLPKPFTMMELVARINAIERRLHPKADTSSLAIRVRRGLWLYPTHCSYRQQSIALRFAEATFLRILWQSRPAVVSKEALRQTPGLPTTAGALATLVYRVKKILAHHHLPLAITCLYNRGYLIEIHKQADS